MEPSEVFTLRNVSVTLRGSMGENRVLEGLDLGIRRGEIYGIVGRSGSGKTTLLRLLAGLVPASSGELLLNGAPMSGPSAAVVTVFQDYVNALLPWRTVAKNVALGIEDTLRGAERAERVAESLRLVALESSAGEHPRNLSGGMQQRVQIARALAVRPQVLLMDEPFGALDAMTRASLQDELRRVQAQTGATIIFITHDVDEAVYLSDHVFIIGGAPGSIQHRMQTELPDERDQLTTRELSRYLEVRHELTTAMAHAARA